MISFNLNYLLEGLNSKYNHTELVRALTYEFGGGTLQSITG